MKALAQIVIFVLCFFTTNYEAQIYFNNRIDLFTKGDISANIFLEDSNYYVSGGGLDITQTNLSLSVLKINVQGNEIASKHYFKNQSWFYSGIGNAINKLNDSMLCNVGHRTDVGYNSYGYIYTYKKNLDSIRYKEYGYPSKTNVIASSLIYNKNFIYLLGYTDSSQTNSDILLIKTDTAGNEIWKKKIGAAGWDEEGLSIDTVQNNLIIAGNKYPHSTSNTIGFVMRLDTSGTIIWQKTVLTNGGYGGCIAKTLKDGNVLIYSRYKMYTFATNDYYRLQVEKITPNNVSQWTQFYNAPAIEANPYSAMENKHGNIVIVGQKGYSPGIKVNGSINEIAQNGDSLFSKEYAYQVGCQNYLIDLVQSPDDGYCFAGFTAPIFANGCTGSQDIWLLKVDSNFCESNVSCGYPTGVRNIYIEMGVMSLYPNPAQNELIFKFENGVSEDATIAFMDILGKLVVEYPLQINVNNEAKLNVSELPNGLYYYRIKQHNAASIPGKVTILK